MRWQGLCLTAFRRKVLFPFPSHSHDLGRIHHLIRLATLSSSGGEHRRQFFFLSVWNHELTHRDRRCQCAVLMKNVGVFFQSSTFLFALAVSYTRKVSDVRCEQRKRCLLCIVQGDCRNVFNTFEQKFLKALLARSPINGGCPIAWAQINGSSVDGTREWRTQSTKEIVFGDGENLTGEERSNDRSQKAEGFGRRQLLTDSSL
mmetsp:Transcript_16944/g.50678  ORF Transcript_16944/g.50678 Transcript_16944/m.50678 type:complete len:203 (+) Transcript_16944:1307-1915(+)